MKNPPPKKTRRAARRSPLLLALCLTASARAADPFAEMVRTSPWLSPAEEAQSFSLPEGFAIQLVAAEPDIGKPISLSFDPSGQLWIAETRSYPLPPSQTPHDAIRILSQFQPNGTPSSNRLFADNLALPDAVTPYRQGALAFSAPNIVNLQDTNGDGRADHQETILGPFAVNDAHNMVNNFRRGFDGWIYAGQGVGNQSALRGRDGRPFAMSGGAFRFRPDGASIEKFSDGQANVFGLCFDPLGNLFTSDCHSMPIYQNIYGGFYPVFGKPHDGLGYAPQMLDHNHGSTAISGLISIAEPLWPPDFQGNFLLGNVVTSRINRDRIALHGSTKVAVEMPDFLQSRDPWFRPVDVQFGPDGALYIADFYNRIIAHVEVPLDHPGRDRQSGRLWRIVKLGPDGQPLLRSRTPFLTLSLPEKILQLGDPSLAHRLAVLNALADQPDPALVDALLQARQARPADLPLQAASLWLLERLGALAPPLLASAAHHPDPLLRTHALHILVERPHWQAHETALVLQALQDPDGFVARAAADALARHPDPAFLLPLLALRHRAPAEDTHLVYQVRKALRDQLLLPASFPFLATQTLKPADVAAIADVALALPSPAAAAFLAQSLAALPDPRHPSPDWLRHIARYLSPEQLDPLANSLAVPTSLDPSAQLAQFEAARQGLDQRGLPLSSAFRSWANQVAQSLLAPTSPPNPNAQIAAATLISQLQLPSLEDPLAALLRDPSADPRVRAASLRALLSLRPAPHLEQAAALLSDGRFPLDSRREIASALAALTSPESRAILTQCLRQAPDRLALHIATALAGSAPGADALVEAISLGRAPASLLTQPSLRDRLLALRPALAETMTRLTATLSPHADRLQQVVAARQAEFSPTTSDPAAGALLFQLHCAVCHHLNGQGGRVGPELDGIGHRGLERLCEDVLDPNRNVDQVFRYSVATLKDGRAIAGLFRRQEGALLIFTEASGQEIAVDQSEVLERHQSTSSLMPEVFGDLLTPSDFQNLMAFLLAQISPP